MEIDAPAYAVAIWIEGDNFVVRFPDRQAVTIPLAEPRRLITILSARRSPAARLRAIGTDACPTQWDIDHARQQFHERTLVETKALLEELNLL